MKTLIIAVEDGLKRAVKQYPLEPFQLMDPQVAADGFLKTVRELIFQVETMPVPEVPAPATAPAEAPKVDAAAAWKAQQAKGVAKKAFDQPSK
jgi:hypothetical protein